jgi:hypothetical protein
VAASVLLVGELFVERVAAAVSGAAGARRTRLAYPRLRRRTLRRAPTRLLAAYRLHLLVAIAVVVAPYLLAHVGA